MSIAAWVLVVFCLIYVGWRIATDPVLIAKRHAKKASDTQPIVPPEPKPFTPLAELLGPVDKFDDQAALQPPLPLERVLPHKRSHKKREK
jgi:hypothetical protein